MLNMRALIAVLLLPTVYACVSLPVDPMTGTAELTLERGHCSGAVVRFDDSRDEELAMLLTAGHCLPSGQLPLSVVMNGETGNRPVDIGGLLYQALDGRDIAVLELNETYGELRLDGGFTAFTLARSQAPVETKVSLRSAFLQSNEECSIDTIVPEHIHPLEGPDGPFTRTFDNIIELGCFATSGASGSPVIELDSNELVGVVYSIQLNNSPCPDNADPSCVRNSAGELVKQEFSHSLANPVEELYRCRDASGRFDPDVASCPLPLQHSE